MPWIPLYLDETDAEKLLAWLNEESQIAFIVREAPGKLRAKPNLNALPIGRTPLWEANSGPLPHFKLMSGLFGTKQVEGSVDDPWAGWEETVSSASGDPWFGPGHPGVISLHFHPASRERPGGIGVSGFEWIGNHYSRIGHPAADSTVKWWERLRRWVKKSSRMIPATGPVDGPDKVQHAFPSAFARISAGTWRDRNPSTP